MIRHISNNGQTTNGKHLSVEAVESRAASRHSQATAGVLLRSSCPSAIAWLVVAIGVGVAIQAEAIGANAHVFNKSLKGIKPSLADCYPAPAVVSEVRIAGICATLNHVLPAAVNWRSRHSVSFAGERCLLATKTATTLRLPASDVCCECDDGISAFATALPHYMLASLTSEANYSKSPEFSASEIDSLGAKDRIGVSHCMTPDTSCVWLEPHGVDSTVCGSLHSSRSGCQCEAEIPRTNQRQPFQDCSWKLSTHLCYPVRSKHSADSGRSHQIHRHKHPHSCGECDTPRIGSFGMYFPCRDCSNSQANNQPKGRC